MPIIRPRRFSSTTTFIQISLITHGTPPMTPCRPMAAQAAKTGRRVRRGPAMAKLFGDTQMSFGAEGRRFSGLNVALGFGGSLLLTAPHVGVEAVLHQQLAVAAAFGDPA